MKEKAKETKKPNILVKPHQMYRGKDYVSGKEYARIVGRDYSTIKKKLRAGNIPCIKTQSGAYLIKADTEYVDLRHFNHRGGNRKKVETKKVADKKPAAKKVASKKTASKKVAAKKKK